MAEIALVTHHQWLEQCTDEFHQYSQSAALDARVLLSHCLSQPMSYVLSWPDRHIDVDIIDKLNRLKQRRLQGEPIAYIVGTREFWSLPFKVTSDVLIPRPETELLVEWALSSIDDSLNESSNGIKLLELGTGSGAIAVALATENDRFHIVATDISEAALTVARDNAARNHCCNITFLCGSWFECLNETDFDIILSNPPYVEESDPHLSEGDLPFEPRSALIAEENGLADIQCLIKNAKFFLKSGGWLGIEHGYNQGRVVRNLMLKNGYQRMKTIEDLAGIERVTVCCWSADRE